MNTAEKSRLEEKIEKAKSRRKMFDSRIAAIKQDLARELDGERKVVLQDRLEVVENNRVEVERELEQLEKELQTITRSGVEAESQTPDGQEAETPTPEPPPTPPPGSGAPGGGRQSPIDEWSNWLNNYLWWKFIGLTLVLIGAIEVLRGALDWPPACPSRLAATIAAVAAGGGIFLWASRHRGLDYYRRWDRWFTLILTVGVALGLGWLAWQACDLDSPAPQITYTPTPPPMMTRTPTQTATFTQAPTTRTPTKTPTKTPFLTFTHTPEPSDTPTFTPRWPTYTPEPTNTPTTEPTLTHTPRPPATKPPVPPTDTPRPPDTATPPPIPRDTATPPPLPTDDG